MANLSQCCHSSHLAYGVGEAETCHSAGGEVSGGTPPEATTVLEGKGGLVVYCAGLGADGIEHVETPGSPSGSPRCQEP